MGIAPVYTKRISEILLNRWSTSDLLKMQDKFSPATQVIVQQILDSRNNYTPEVKGRMAAGLRDWPLERLREAEKVLKEVGNVPAHTLVQTEINRRLHDGLQNDTAA